MTLLLFLLLIAILIIVLIVVKTGYINKSVLNTPKVNKNRVKTPSNINYKSGVFDNLGNFHVKTNNGVFLKTSDKLLIHPTIPNNATLLGYYTKTHEIFYILENERVVFIDENNTLEYTLDQLYNIPQEYYALINSIVPDNNGNTIIVLTTGKALEYSHKEEKVINETKQISCEFDFVIAEPVTQETLIINGDTYSPLSNQNSEKLVHEYFSNFFNNSRVVINNLNYKGITGPSENDSLLSRDTFIEQELHNYTVPRTGEYTIELVGAGIENGGAGTKLVSRLNLNERDNLKFLIGNSGFRFPSQENSYEAKSKLLPNQASCSGAGASCMLVNNKLTLVAAGGGGWSSSIYKPPCNSSECSKNSATFVVPIKAIVIDNPSSVEISSVKSHNWVTPKYSVKSGKYIEFDEVLTDYNITFNKPLSEFTIVTSNSRQRVENFDLPELSNQILIEKIYGKSLLTLENNESPKKNVMASAGFSISTSSDFNEMKRVSVAKSKPGYNIAFGGLGGGGFAAEKLTSSLSNCGGGGGFTGGKSCVSNFTDDTINLTNHVVDSNSPDNTVEFNGRKTIVPLTCGSSGESYYSTKHETGIIKIPGFNKNSGYAIIHPPTNSNLNSKENKSIIPKNTLEGTINIDTNYPFVEIDIPQDKSRINLNVLFYPENEAPVIHVSVHSFILPADEECDWITRYTYFQNGSVFESDEIQPEKVPKFNNNIDNSIANELNNYIGNKFTQALVYTSNESIKHTQSFNTIPGIKSIYVLMKFSGKYKITIT